MNRDILLFYEEALHHNGVLLTSRAERMIMLQTYFTTVRHYKSKLFYLVPLREQATLSEILAEAATHRLLRVPVNALADLSKRFREKSFLVAMEPIKLNGTPCVYHVSKTDAHGRRTIDGCPILNAPLMPIIEWAFVKLTRVH